MALLEVEALAKRYAATRVFANVSLRVGAGEFVAILGESGVGKSTLLNCIAGLDSVDAGSVRIDGVEVTTLAEADAAALRRRRLGFVFQAFHVLPHLSVFHNVALPLLLLQRPDAARVRAVLAAVGLDALEARLPRQLSGGQLQRVVLARTTTATPYFGNNVRIEEVPDMLPPLTTAAAVPKYSSCRSHPTPTSRQAPVGPPPCTDARCISSREAGERIAF